jgi:hypothetical protein
VIRPVFEDGPDPVFPASLDPAYVNQILRPLRTPTWTDRGPGGVAYRRYITEKSPLLFLITYFGGRLRNADTGQMSFCDFHLDACSRAKACMGREPRRYIDVAPRNAGKSILFFEGLPTWVLAHGHRRFFAAFSFTGDQSKTHYHDLLDIVSGKALESERLLADFPELLPIRGSGGPKMTVLQGNNDGRRAIAAFGLHESVHGLRMDEVRPDFMVGDDIDPGESKYTPKTKQKAVSAIAEKILPMNRRAIVQIVGTVTARGSTIHDAVRSARGELTSSWVQEAQFEAHHYPAIIDEGLPTERSYWEQQEPIRQLKKDRYNPDGTLNRAFALGMMNDPVRETVGAYWDREFRYRSLSICFVRRWVCWVDPAKTTFSTSDHTAYVVAGLLSTQCPAVVIAAADAGHWSPLEARQRLDTERQRFPGLQVFVEYNALGSAEAAINQYQLVHGDKAEWAKAPKELRIRAAADVYAEDLVAHARPLTKLEQALIDYGSAERDDLPDALAGALGALLPGKIPA